MGRFISSMFVALAAFIGLIAFPISGAKADTVWTLSNVLFDDGATATGTFTVNVYGYLTESSISVATTSGTTLVGDIYNATFVSGNINDVSGTGLPDNTVQFFSSTVGYEGMLQLTFSHALSSPLALNAIVGGSLGPSWECGVGWGCPPYSGTPIRYVTEGFVTAFADSTGLTGATPLPAALPLFATGLGAFSLLGWRRKRKGAATRAA